MKLNYSDEDLRTPRRHQSTWTHLCRGSVAIELVLCRVSSVSVDDDGNSRSRADPCSFGHGAHEDK